MDWHEIEDIVSDSKNRLNSTLSLIDFEKNGGQYENADELFGKDGAVKDVAKVFDNVTALCDYMFSDGKIDIIADLLEIQAMADKLHHEAMKNKSRGLLAIYSHKVVQNIDIFLKRRDYKPQSGNKLSETPPEPQRLENEIEGSSRKLGRKRIPVKDLILLNDKDKVFAKLQENMKGKSKDAAMTILINNIKNEILLKPSWMAFCDAFPEVEIKEGTYYYKLRKAEL